MSGVRFLLAVLLCALLAVPAAAQNPIGIISGATPTIGFAKNQCATSSGSTVVAAPCTIILASSGAASSVTGTTSETQLATITVPANAMGPNGKLRITTTWSLTNSANTKTTRIRFSGSGGTQFMNVPLTASGSLQWITLIQNNNSAAAQKSIPTTNSPYGAGSAALISSAVDTTVATTIYISGQLATSSETITLEAYTVELIPGA